MNYPGNSSLGDEVRNRILTTFSQSLDLAEKGRHQEALLGCDFILELDPRFAPAKQLKARLADDAVKGGQGAQLDDLRALVAGGAGGASSSESDDLLDLEDFELPEAAGEAGVTPAETPSTEGGEQGARAALAAELDGLLAARRFQAVLDRAEEQRDLVTADPDLRHAVETAQSRLEAEPYLESFLKDAGSALREGDVARADAALDKARSLDPSHPLIAELESARPEAEAGAGGPGPTIDEERREAVFELGSEDADLDLSLDDETGAGTTIGEDEDLLEGFEVPDTATEDARGESGPGGESALDLGDEAGEGDDRIAQLLAEGQEAADRGDHQEAIDAWSRIFLIDVDHEEAARRIEEARRLKAEREREVEEILHDGVASLERGDRDAARERFEKILAVQPNHLAAQEYLKQIESGAPVTGPGPSPRGAEGEAGELGSFDLSDLSGEGDEESGEPLKEEILVPPAPSAEAEAGETDAAGTADATPSPRRVAAGASSGRRRFVLIGGAVLVVVLVAAWFLVQNKDRFFPNSTAEEEVSAAPEGPSVLDRARQLHEGGRTAMAIGQLKRLRPDHPDYEEARELVAEWEAPREAETEEAAPTVSEENLARRDDLLGRAGRAFEREEYLRALELYDGARDIAPLGAEEEERFRIAARELEPLSREIELFRQGEYEMVMPELWRLLEDDPSNRVVRRLLVDSYYNRGVRELQRGDAARAVAELQEALALAPDDQRLRRHYLFAQTYERRSKDLLYRIYVKYLPFR